jgi:rubrerythrin
MGANMASIQPPPIGTLAELLSMARAMEEAAAKRYRELATRMRLRGEERLVALFEFLAAVEDKHAKAVADRAAHTAANPASIARDVPETFDDEAGSSRLLTPYRALAVAVRNEERAFAFFTYVAAEAPDPETREVAEALAKDELAHAVLLRQERRKAYRGEGRQRRHEGVPTSLDQLLALCSEIEQRAAQYHRELAAGLPAEQASHEAFAEVAADEARAARDAAMRVGRTMADAPSVASPTLFGGLRLIEEAFDRYADIADRAKDETVMREAQLMAERTVRRLSFVNEALRAPSDTAQADPR